MPNKKKIPAFTLSEMIVVMVITTIVVALVFAVLNLVRRQTGTISQNYTEAVEKDKLFTSLWIDFHSFEQIRASVIKNGQKLQFINPDRKVSYFIYKDRIIKGKDTFPPIGKITYFGEGKNVRQGKVDAVQLGDKSKYFVFRTNAAAYYLNE